MRWIAAVLLLAGAAHAKTLSQCAPALAPYAADTRTAAEEFAVPTALLAAVAMQESGGRAHAIRYEPSFPLSNVNLADAKSAGWTPADLRTSWGLMQIMGAVAFQALHAHDPPSVIEMPAYNLRLGAKFLRALRDSTGSWQDAVAYYNGGYGSLAELTSGHTVPYVSSIVQRWGDIAACEASP